MGLQTVIKDRIKYVLKPRLKHEKEKIKELDLGGHVMSTSRERWFNMKKQTEAILTELDIILRRCN